MVLWTEMLQLRMRGIVMGVLRMFESLLKRKVSLRSEIFPLVRSYSFSLNWDNYLLYEIGCTRTSTSRTILGSYTKNKLSSDILARIV